MKVKGTLFKKVPPLYAFGSVLLLAILVVWVVLYFAYQNDFAREASSFEEYGAFGKASLLLNFGDGKMRKFEGDTVGGMTVYDALNQSAKAGGFEVETTLEEGSVVVEAIDGVRNRKDKTWHFYLNESFKNRTSPLNYSIRNGDVVEFRYEAAPGE